MRIPVFVDGETLLLQALTFDTNADPEVIRLLLAEGSDVNARGVNDDTPLMRAAYDLRPDLAQVLLKSGRADVNAVQYGSNTALHLIAEKLSRWSPHIEAKEYRERHIRRMELVRMLLEAGLHADAKSTDGETFLHTVLNQSVYKDMSVEEQDLRRQEQTELVELLLDKNANVNLQDKHGNTPLHYAYSNPAVVRLLLAAGSDPSIVNSEGETPLQMFNRQSGANPECIALLS